MKYVELYRVKTALDCCIAFNDPRDLTVVLCTRDTYQALLEMLDLDFKKIRHGANSANVIMSNGAKVNFLFQHSRDEDAHQLSGQEITNFITTTKLCSDYFTDYTKTRVRSRYSHCTWQEFHYE